MLNCATAEMVLGRSSAAPAQACAVVCVACMLAQVDLDVKSAGGGKAVALPEGACLNPLQYIQGLAAAITGARVKSCAGAMLNMQLVWQV